MFIRQLYYDYNHYQRCYDKAKAAKVLANWNDRSMHSAHTWRSHQPLRNYTTKCARACDLYDDNTAGVRRKVGV